MKVTISRGNTKIGRTMNISLPPIKTCAKGVPCAKDCYAMKAYSMYPGTIAAWDGNLECYKKEPDQYWFEIHAALKKAKSATLFRWHVGGDIVDSDYLHGMYRIAQQFPKTSFLCFTKQYGILEKNSKLEIPGNLRLILSAWPGLKIPKSLLWMSKAWMWDPCNQDGRISDEWDECPGACETCGLCWKMTTGDNVVFNKH